MMLYHKLGLSGLSGLGLNLVGDGSGCGDCFITTWRTTGSAETVTLPATSASNNFEIDWGDGTIETISSANPSHEYADAGDYDVKILGTCPNWFQNNGGDKAKLRTIKQWGNNAWAQLNNGFKGCSNMLCTAPDSPDTSACTNLGGLFSECSSLITVNLSGCDTSNATSFAGMFFNCTSLHSLNVTNFNTENATAFNHMFYNCVSLVSLDVSGFNTTKATSTSSMFFNCSSAADLDASSWIISALTSASSMFQGSSHTTAKYSLLLVNWEAQAQQPNVSFHAGSAQYTAGASAAARGVLVADGWSITDGGAA